MLAMIPLALVTSSTLSYPEQSRNADSFRKGSDARMKIVDLPVFRDCSCLARVPTGCFGEGLAMALQL